MYFKQALACVLVSTAVLLVFATAGSRSPKASRVFIPSTAQQSAESNFPVYLASPLGMSVQTASPLKSTRDAMPTESQLCGDQWKQIAELDIKSYETSIDGLLNRLDEIALQPYCGQLNSLPNSFVKSSAEVSKWCALSKKLGTEKASRTNYNGIPEKDRNVYSPLTLCLRAVTLLREEIADVSTDGIAYEKIKDIPTLFHKFNARARKDPWDLQTLHQLSERMLEIDSRNPETAALAFKLSYAEWRRSTTVEKPSTDVVNKYSLLEQLKPTHGLEQYKVHHDLTTGNLEAVRLLGTKQVALNAGKYFLAQLAVREGRAQEAKGYLYEILNSSDLNYKVNAQIAMKRLKTRNLSSINSVFLRPGVVLSNALHIPAQASNAEQVVPGLSVTLIDYELD